MKLDRALVAAALLALAAAAPAGAVTVTIKDLEFNGTTLPSADGLEYTSFGPFISPESSAYSVSGGLLHQRTVSQPGRADYFFPGFTQTGAGIDPAKNLVAEFRVQIFSVSGNGGAYFEVGYDSIRYGAYFDTTGVRLPTGLSPQAVSVDTTQFHTYRFEAPANGNTYSFFVDGVLRAQGVAPPLTPTDYFGFGDQNDDDPLGQFGLARLGRGDADWDFVRVFQPDALTPVPEPFAGGLAALSALVLAALRRHRSRA